MQVYGSFLTAEVHFTTVDAQACNLLRLPIDSCQASAKLLNRPLPLSLPNPCCVPATRNTALLPWLTSLYSTKRRRCSASCRVIPTLQQRQAHPCSAHQASVSQQCDSGAPTNAHCAVPDRGRLPSSAHVGSSIQRLSFNNRRSLKCGTGMATPPLSP